MSGARLAIVAIVVFLAALAGVAVGHRLFAAAPPDDALHEVLHGRLTLDHNQKKAADTLEARFAVRRAALEAAMRAENAELAAAIAAEQRIGPRVTAAIDASHHTMGQLQKETLAHVFAMRRLLRPDQARTFDAAVGKALTADGR